MEDEDFLDKESFYMSIILKLFSSLVISIQYLVVYNHEFIALSDRSDMLYEIDENFKKMITEWLMPSVGINAFLLVIWVIILWRGTHFDRFYSGKTIGVLSFVYILMVAFSVWSIIDLQILIPFNEDYDVNFIRTHYLMLQLILWVQGLSVFMEYLRHRSSEK